MGKHTPSNSFRLCIALLLAVQALCWILTLLDLFSPGKPLALFRKSSSMLHNSTDGFTQLFARRASALLVYKDVRAQF